MRPVVTPQTMRDIEKQAEASGISQESMMENAGKQATGFILDFVEEQKIAKHALVLVGKGNNGGDGYVIARILLRHGFTVQVWQLLECEEFSLAKHQRKRFETCGGKVIDRGEQKKELPKEGVVIDAIFGTGFKGSLPPLVEAIICEVNDSSLPCIAIDIPSGLDALEGSVDSVAIVAGATVAIEFPKIGYFVGKGFDHIGVLKTVPIGGLEPFLTAPQFVLLEEPDVQGLLPKIQRTCNKYTRGHVVGLAGSHGMAGSALLSSFGSLKSGAGIVHLLVPEEYAHEFALPPLEVVRVGYKKEETEKLLFWLEKASSCFIGPGLSKECSFILPLLQKIHEKKMVLDADAIAQIPSLKGPYTFPNAIFTPHMGEVQKLLGTTNPEPLTTALLEKCRVFTETHQAHMVLKGAPTFLFSKAQPITIVIEGDPGMATAGSGDVLTGILASLLAQGKSASDAMKLGVYLHALAGKLAAEEETSYCMTASSLFATLPLAFKRLVL